MIMQASQLIAIGFFGAIFSAFSNAVARPDQAVWPVREGPPAAVAMQLVEIGVAERFRGVRRSTLKFVKRGETVPVFMLSADVGEIDAVDNLTITLDNDAPFRRGDAVWQFPVRWPAGPVADPAPPPLRINQGEVDHPIRLPIAVIGEWLPTGLPGAWRPDGQMPVTTTMLPLIGSEWFALAAVDRPLLRSQFTVATVAEPPAQLLLSGGIAALGVALARRRLVD
jgi:hypothetical protein